MPDRPLPLYLHSLVAIVAGCAGLTALGAGIGWGIAAIGDPTAAAVVPVVLCAALGFVSGGAFGASVALQARGQRRTGAAGAVVFIVMLVDLVGSVVVGNSTGLPFYVLLPLGPILAAFLASALANAGQPTAP